MTTKTNILTKQIASNHKTITEVISTYNLWWESTTDKNWILRDYFTDKPDDFIDKYITSVRFSIFTHKILNGMIIYSKYYTRSYRTQIMFKQYELNILN